MKKTTFYLLALFCLAFSWQGQGQIFIDESLDSGVPTNWTSDNYFANTTADNLCEGTGSLYNNLFYDSWDDIATNGNLTSPNYLSISNETDVTISFDWLSKPYTTNAVDYVIYVEYSTNDGTDWNVVSSFAVTETTACSTYSEVIPAASVPAASDFKFRIRGEWLSGDSYFYLDNINLSQTISCAQPSDLLVSNLESDQADLSWTENGTATAYNVEVVIAGDAPTGTATDTGVANPYTKTGLSPDTAYEFYVQADCTGGDLSAWAGPVSFFTGYCIPASTAAGTYTDAFEVTGALMNTSTTGTGYTGTGYADYYDTNTIESFEGGAFDFSATIVGGTAGYAIWIDWNNDLVFDAATETVYNTTSYASGPFESSITVPEGTALGDYRLRTMVDYSDSNPDDNACAFGSTRGEVEDYKLTIVAAPTDEMDFNNVQWVTDGTNGSDVSLTVDAGTAITVYAKGYEAGVTDAVGQGAGVECWIAINDENTDPSTWNSSMWQVATYENDNGGDDEYAYTTSTTAVGTNYVAARWRLNNAGFTYGGYNGTWDGTTNLSIELIISPLANDDCSGAIALTPGGTFEDNSIDGSVSYATADAETNGCGSNGAGVWYSVVVPDSGDITIETAPDAATGDTGFDSLIEAFSGTCGALTSIDCDDDGGPTNLFSLLELTGLTPASTIYIRVWESGGNEEEPFSISAYSASLGVNNFETEAAFTYYPNPVKNTLTLNAQNTIEQVAMYNMLGQEVLRATPNSVDSDLDMSNLQTGTYFVKVTIANVTETIRVIKQ